MWKVEAVSVKEKRSPDYEKESNTAIDNSRIMKDSKRNKIKGIKEAKINSSYSEAD